VLVETLGEEFNGVLGCDYFGAYRKYMRKFDVLIQFCLAHLIRDVKFLTTLPDKKQKAYGERIREALRELFAVIHRREKLSEAGFARKLEAARAEVVRVATTRVPQGKHAQNLAKRFHKHGEAYFQFITTPGIEPTNNLAEQAIRFVVIDRRMPLGLRVLVGIGRISSSRYSPALAPAVKHLTALFHPSLLDMFRGSTAGPRYPRERLPDFDFGALLLPKQWRTAFFEGLMAADGSAGYDARFDASACWRASSSIC